MNLDYGGILRRAWEITWRNKALWILGILSALGSGGANFGGGSNFNFNQGQGPDGPPRFDRLFGDLDQNVVLAIVIGVGCLLVVCAIALYVLSVIGRGGLIGGINEADRTGSVRLGEAWGIGVKYFWTVLLIGLAVAIVGLLIGLASFVALATICLAPLACLGFLLIAVLNVFTYLAQIAAVTENLSVSDAITRAWGIVKANLGAVIILGLILAVARGVIGFLVALPLAAIAAPLLLAVGGFANENAAVANTGLLIAGLCLVAWIPVLIIVSGIVETWVTSAWTVSYRRLSGQTGMAPAAPMAPALGS